MSSKVDIAALSDQRDEYNTRVARIFVRFHKAVGMMAVAVLVTIFASIWGSWGEAGYTIASIWGFCVLVLQLYVGRLRKRFMKTPEGGAK